MDDMTGWGLDHTCTYFTVLDRWSGKARAMGATLKAYFSPMRHRCQVDREKLRLIDKQAKRLLIDAFDLGQ